MVATPDRAGRGSRGARLRALRAIAAKSRARAPLRVTLTRHKPQRFVNLSTRLSREVANSFPCPFIGGLASAQQPIVEGEEDPREPFG